MGPGRAKMREETVSSATDPLETRSEADESGTVVYGEDGRR
ncbi:MAG: hypothetical protein JWO67_2809 [Streptosporangiaceae bacterium]|jgi:hypothetical protein|nr:hypothetical protein [Streptosporangiaceae bacterium]